MIVDFLCVVYFIRVVVLDNDISRRYAKQNNNAIHVSMVQKKEWNDFESAMSIHLHCIHVLNTNKNGS